MTALAQGDLVLLKLKKQHKSTPLWDPDPYRVSHVKGTLITAERDDRTTTRNCSCFKLFRHNDADESLQIEMPTDRSPAADASPLHEQPIAQADPAPAPNEFVSEPHSSPLHVSFSPEAPEESETEVTQPSEDNNIAAATPQVATTPVPAKGPGRPTKEQAVINAANRATAVTEKRSANPPTRSSARLAKQNQEPGRM